MKTSAAIITIAENIRRGKTSHDEEVGEVRAVIVIANRKDRREVVITMMIMRKSAMLRTTIDLYLISKSKNKFKNSAKTFRYKSSSVLYTNIKLFVQVCYICIYSTEEIYIEKFLLNF